MLTTANEFDYIRESMIMGRLDDDHKKAHVKKLWEKNPDEYFKWKDWCIRLSILPEFFGTCDDPIPIDESKL